MFDGVAVARAIPSHGTSDKSGLVCYRRTGVGDLHGAAIRDSLEETKKRDLMRGETGTGGGIGSDLRDM